MNKYSTWKIYLLTQVHSGLLVSKQFFQVKYSIVGQLLKIYCIGFGIANFIAKFLDYQILDLTDALIIKVVTNFCGHMSCYH